MSLGAAAALRPLRSAPPSAHRSPSTATSGRAAPAAPALPPAATPLQGGAVTISLTARTWGSSSPGPQLEPSRNRGPSPDPHSASPPPRAPSQPLARCKGSANAAGRAKESASVYSVTHVTSPGSESAPGLGAPSAPPAPGTPQQSFLELHSSAQLGTDRRSVGSWRDGCWAEAEAAKNEEQGTGL